MSLLTFKAVHSAAFVDGELTAERLQYKIRRWNRCAWKIPKGTYPNFDGTSMIDGVLNPACPDLRRLQRCVRRQTLLKLGLTSASFETNSLTKGAITQQSEILRDENSVWNVFQLRLRKYHNASTPQHGISHRGIICMPETKTAQQRLIICWNLHPTVAN